MNKIKAKSVVNRNKTETIFCTYQTKENKIKISKKCP